MWVKPWCIGRGTETEGLGGGQGCWGHNGNESWALTGCGMWVTHSRKPALCFCSLWGPNWIWHWKPANSQALSKETGWEPLRMSSRAWRTQGGGCCVGCRDPPPTASAPSPYLPHPRQILSTPAHKEGSAVRGPGSPRSGLSRRISAAAEASRAPPLPVPSACGHGPASSLGHTESPQCQAPGAPVLCALWLFVVLHFLPSPTGKFRECKTLFYC